MAKNIMDIWFVSDPATENVEQVLLVGPLGMQRREDVNWVYMPKGDSTLDSMTGMDIYQYDWDSDTSELPDNYTEEDLTPESVKMFDRGELTISDLDGIADRIYEGTSED